MRYRISIILAVLAASVEASAGCTNFAGDWQGSCTNPEQAKVKSPALLTIAQDGCEKFTANSMTQATIGETFNERYEEQDYVGYVTQNFDWNRAQTILYASELNSDRVTDDDRSGSWVSSELAFTTYEIKGGILHRDIERVKFKVDNGVKGENRLKFHCEYERTSAGS